MGLFAINYERRELRATERFEQIYNENVQGIYGFLYKLSSNPDLCEELTQECFYQAFISFHRYNGTCEIFTWLCAIAKNTYFKYLRRHRVAVADYTLLADELTDESDTPEDAVLRTDVSERVRAVIDSLKPKYRDVVILRTYASLSFAQISKILGMSENSAKVIFFRAKNMIREELKNENE